MLKLDLGMTQLFFSAYLYLGTVYLSSMPVIWLKILSSSEPIPSDFLITLINHAKTRFGDDPVVFLSLVVLWTSLFEFNAPNLIENYGFVWANSIWFLN